MDIATSIGKAFNYLRHYMMGRGLLSFCIFVASAVQPFGLGIWTAAAIAGIGGMVISTLGRLGEQAAYETQMLNLYRTEIAEGLGRDPNNLTRADLREAAQSNEVIAQALARQDHKTLISIVTQALSAVVTVVTVGWIGQDGFNGLRTSIGNALGNFWGAAAHFIGIGTVAGLSSLVAHDGLAAAIGEATGVSKAAAHDRILDMQQGLDRGIATTPEKVYGVLVAGDPHLAHSIAQRFHKPYAGMTAAQQQTVLARVGVAEAMQNIAQEINSGVIEPGKLAYMVGEEFHEQRKAQGLETGMHEPVLQNFVERLGLKPHEHRSHRAQVDASRADAATRNVG